MNCPKLLATWNRLLTFSVDPFLESLLKEFSEFLFSTKKLSKNHAKYQGDKKPFVYKIQAADSAASSALRNWEISYILGTLLRTRFSILSIDFSQADSFHLFNQIKSQNKNMLWKNQGKNGENFEFIFGPLDDVYLENVLTHDIKVRELLNTEKWVTKNCIKNQRQTSF